MGTNQTPATIRLELTEPQQQQVAEALGVKRLVGGPSGEVGIELRVDELERRILPGFALN